MLLIYISYLTLLERTIGYAKVHNRKLNPDSVYRLLIPIYNLFFYFTLVDAISETLRAEFKERGWVYKTQSFGNGIGIVMNILSIATTIFYIWIAYNASFNTERIAYIISETLYGNIYIFTVFLGSILWISYWSTISSYCKMLMINTNYLKTEAFNSNNCSNCMTPKDSLNDFCGKCGAKYIVVAAEPENIQKFFAQSLPETEAEKKTKVGAETKLFNEIPDPIELNAINSSPNYRSAGILILFFLTILGLLFYQNNLSSQNHGTVDTEITYREETDSHISNSLPEKQEQQENEDYISSQNAYSDSQLEKSKNEQAVHIMIKYFNDITSDEFDASSIFADTVSRYISLQSIDPDQINESYQVDKHEYQKQIFIFDQNSIQEFIDSDGIQKYRFDVEFQCYRTSKAKFQKSKCIAEFGFNNSNKIVSFYFPKIYSLNYYETEQDM